VIPDLRWLDAQHQPNDYFPQLRGTAMLDMTSTATVFEGGEHEAKEVYELAKAGKPASFALLAAARITIVSSHQDIQSRNIVARIRGSDPDLKDEYLLFTAHLDHLGIGEPVNGDSIYNGALDNAARSACLVEIAGAFAELTPAPRRSILFVSVTGEEEGLLGSDYFAHHSTVPKNALVANINLDGAACSGLCRTSLRTKASIPRRVEPCGRLRRS
jgi:Zn-dependent M28 family amino/carboxypeptidase